MKKQTMKDLATIRLYSQQLHVTIDKPYTIEGRQLTTLRIKSLVDDIIKRETEPKKDH